MDSSNFITIDARGDISVFDSAGFTNVRGITINVDSDAFSETSFFFRPEASVLFTAGFTNGTPNANYTGYGGNGTTTGTFAGAGANPPLPLADRPAFDGGP